MPIRAVELPYCCELSVVPGDSSADIELRDVTLSDDVRAAGEKNGNAAWVRTKMKMFCEFAALQLNAFTVDEVAAFMSGLLSNRPRWSAVGLLLRGRWRQA